MFFQIPHLINSDDNAIFLLQKLPCSLLNKVHTKYNKNAWHNQAFFQMFF